MEDKMHPTFKKLDFEDLDLSVRRLTMFIIYFGKTVWEVIPSVIEATDALRQAFSTLPPLSSNPPPQDECKSGSDQLKNDPSPKKPL